MEINNRNLTIFLLFVLSVFLNHNAFAKECRYAQYDSLIVLGKQSYTSKNYKEAKKYFQLAFSKVDFPHGEDLSIALFTAVQVKDDIWAHIIAEKLAKGGIPLRYFVRFKNKKWYPEFESQYGNYSEYFEDNFNRDVGQEFLSLLAKDKDFNSIFHKWRTREIDMSLLELINGATVVLTDFENFIVKYGFPYENLLGYNYVVRKNMVAPYGSFVLLVHIYESGTAFLRDDIDDIVCEGGLAIDKGETLKMLDLAGNCNGIENIMKARYIKYRGDE